MKVRGGRPDAVLDARIRRQPRRQPQGILQPGAARPREFRSARQLERGFGGFWQNLRDLISPPKLPPLQVTSQPVAVKEIWSKNTQFTRVQMLSIAFHVVDAGADHRSAAAGADVAPDHQGEFLHVDVSSISPFLPKLPPGAKKAGGGGGGGEHNPIACEQRSSFRNSRWTQFTPPKVKSRIRMRASQMTPTVLGPPELKLPSPQHG